MPNLSALLTRRALFALLFLLYAGLASFSAWHIVARTQASTVAIEKILNLYNLKNEGEEALRRFDKEHPFLGFFLSSPAQKELKLPSAAAAQDALYDQATHDLKTVRVQSSAAAWSSWFLLSLSLAYVVAVVALERAFTTRAVLFALTTVTVVFFFIGIIAPAMVIWTAPKIPLATGDFEFVVQHQVRGIAAIIWELLQAGHGIIGGFLLLFSVITPLTKATLTYAVTASASRERNIKIATFLHTIGKWSMADVFVAAVLLALYALKFQQATHSIPCLGLYYFIGYCLLSLTTTELLVHSSAASRRPEKPAPLRPAILITLLAIALAYIPLSALYTYDQYTLNIREKITSNGSPSQLNNSSLVLPGHK
jgi:hypothetical protein